jgi:AraC-like DNA-binding protein
MSRRAWIFDLSPHTTLLTITLAPWAGGALLNAPWSSTGKALRLRELDAALEVDDQTLVSGEPTGVLARIVDSFTDRTTAIDGSRPWRQTVPSWLPSAVQHLSDGSGSVSTAAKLAGISERALRETFRRWTGLRPKEFHQLRRFRRFVENSLRSPERWRQAALDAGFVDQAHAHRAFVRYVPGWTPAIFFSHVRTSSSSWGS